MQRNQLIKLVFIVALVIFAVYSLYPTFKLGNLQNQEQTLVANLSEMTGLGQGEILGHVTQGNLETVIRRNTEEDQARALELGRDLIQLNTKIQDIEDNAIRRGLDLQGGTYLVYEVDLPQLMNELAKIKDERLEDIISTTQQQALETGDEFFQVFQQNFEARNIDLNRYYGRKGQEDSEILEELRKEADDAIDRTVEVLRNRVDEFGVSEPSITKQGNRRIVIELAGITNIQRAKDIIGTTALLEFKLLRDSEIIWSVLNDIDRVVRAQIRGQGGEETLADVDTAQADTAEVAVGQEAQDEQISVEDLFGEQAEEQDAEVDTSILVDQNTFDEHPFTSLLRATGGRYADAISVPQQNVRTVQRWLQNPDVQKVIPVDAEFLWSQDTYTYGDQQYLTLYLVKKEPELTGTMLKSANVQIASGDQNFGAGGAEVNMELNSEGTKIFARATGMNVGKRLAIVLDGKVKSAPNIREKIPGGSARIDGLGSMEEAQDLALVLRAGALPAPVHIITENTVGPSLGQDSITKGTTSAIIGLSLVIIFMVIYYRASGFVADLALILNIIFVLAVMASFHATLTLPGIAGIILTVGMAVDANVLIFERIREELKSGKTIRGAIDNGYNRAFTTILDANVTTLITAIVLYSFGTGPIRGFALTLSIGILASMFTAIVVTRLVFDIITTRYSLKKLSI
ncbi:protein translocase subunit SecD [candidate division KSB1 bacterium]|jgi:preprotein translocase subunit SecD|nr:protein translocase subunit SecD [candidate division KSB1 bacterium]